MDSVICMYIVYGCIQYGFIQVITKESQRWNYRNAFSFKLCNRNIL